MERKTEKGGGGTDRRRKVAFLQSVLEVARGGGCRRGSEGRSKTKNPGRTEKKKMRGEKQEGRESLKGGKKRASRSAGKCFMTQERGQEKHFKMKSVSRRS